MGAYIRMCQTFFWVWLILGVFKPGLMALDWVFGTKQFLLTDAYT